MNLNILSLLASTLVMLCGCQRKSDPITDATYTPASLSRSDTIIVADRLSIAQTFTVIASGKLSQVDVPVRWSEHFQPNAPLRLDVRRLNGSVPTEVDSGANILASSTGAPELLVGSSTRRSRGLFPDFCPSPPTKVALTTRILTPRNTHNARQVGEKLPTRTRCSDELLTGPFSHRNLVDNFQSDQSAAQINRLPTKFPIVPFYSFASPDSN